MKCYAVSQWGSATKVNIFRNKKERDNWLNSTDGLGFKKASYFNIVIFLLRCIIDVFIAWVWDTLSLVIVLFGCMFNCLTSGFSVNISYGRKR